LRNVTLIIFLVITLKYFACATFCLASSTVRGHTTCK
jgi:hypothetical protein